MEDFWNRLAEAYGDRTLTGYFEPADPQARGVLPRVYLAPNNAISLDEIVLLLEVILEESPELASMAAKWVVANDPELVRFGSC